MKIYENSPKDLSDYILTVQTLRDANLPLWFRGINNSSISIKIRFFKHLF
jgi:hypothetical protein